MSIEESFEELDSIIKALENSETPLEEAFKEYERGIKIVRECGASLDKVEKQITVLQGNEDEF